MTRRHYVESYIYLDRDGEKREVHVSGVYIPPTPHSYYPPPGHPGDFAEIEDFSAVDEDGKDVDLDGEEYLKAEDALVIAAEGLGGDAW